jgi:putative glycosyltransferase (TIGR04372 family)
LLKWPHFSHGIVYEWGRIQKQGIYKLPLKAAKRILSITLWFVLLPLTFLLHLAGYRRVTVFTDRIGHLALEPDCLLKEEALGIIPKRRWFMLAPPERVANHHLLNYWKPLLRVFEGKFICFILESMSRWWVMRYDISHYILAANKAQAAYRIYAQWGDRLPLISLTQEDKEWGEQAIGQLGLPKAAWFICIHVREAGFSPIDEALHSHRNGNIEKTIPAIKEITRRGGWVIRIGDPSMTPLPPLPKVVDYAHHALKSERLDIILCAKAKFILGSTSGIVLVGSLFGVPCAIANMIPMPDLWYNARDISIPKLLWSESLNRYLRFDEVMASPVAQYRYAVLYRGAGIRVEENSAEDILNLTIEMFDRLEGRFVEQGCDEEFFHYLLSQLHDGHYAFGSCARIGTRFLRSHPELKHSKAE